MLYIIGIGPGGKDRMTLEAVQKIKESDVIVGYKPYIEYVSEFLTDQETFSTGMTGEIERCKKAIEFAKEGKNVSIISTGDAGLYGMAGPVIELLKDSDVEFEVVPGVSAVFSAAADLGAPLMMDTAIISLSDLLSVSGAGYRHPGVHGASESGRQDSSRAAARHPIVHILVHR